MQWVQLSTEEIIFQDPDITVLGDVNFGVTVEDEAQRPGWEVIAAVRGGTLYSIDDDLASRPGPRVVEGIEALSGIIYPDLIESASRWQSHVRVPGAGPGSWWLSA